MIKMSVRQENRTRPDTASESALRRTLNPHLISRSAGIDQNPRLAIADEIRVGDQSWNHRDSRCNLVHAGLPAWHRPGGLAWSSDEIDNLLEGLGSFHSELSRPMIFG